ncbi:MAG: histidinol-phosphate transaminase [Desulfovibrio sp.]|jgi:histidinol-phosphate aminotransferase|nr:histidinol-phosphate transaminase [Desulfovibrio sp.]
MSKTAFPIRPEILDFEEYSPGLSIEDIRRRFGLDRIIKMASNENPLGVSPLALEAMRRHAAFAFRYPRGCAPDLCAALAAYHRLPENCFVPGNGSDEIVDLLLRVCPSPGRHNVVACRSSFSMYRIASRLCGVEFRAVPRRDDFAFDYGMLLEAVDENTALVFIASPDNPSGFCPPWEDLAALARALPSSCLLVLDEAYADFCGDIAAHSLLPRFGEFGNLVVLRTFSKAFGLAGIRLGYGVMPERLADALRSAHMPFSISILAEAAGIAALGDRDFYERTLSVVSEGRSFLTETLAGMGCTCFPSLANFLMFKPPAGRGTAVEIFEGLLARGLIIRSLKSYGLPEHLRVSVGMPEENSLFINALRELIACFSPQPARSA